MSQCGNNGSEREGPGIEKYRLKMLRGKLGELFEENHPVFDNFDEFVMKGDVFSPRHLDDICTLHKTELLDFILFWIGRMMKANSMEELRRFRISKVHIQRIFPDMNEHDYWRLVNILDDVLEKYFDKLIQGISGEVVDDVKADVEACIDGE